MSESRRALAIRKGYMAIGIRERGNVPRNFRKSFNAASKSAWEHTGRKFHEEFRLERFTPEHAKKARYAKRKRSYYVRKLKHPKYGGGPGRADPLTYSGRAKRDSRLASISSTSKSGRIRYPGLRVFNYRNPKSRIRMNDEFRRILPEEANRLAAYYDDDLDLKLKLQDDKV